LECCHAVRAIHLQHAFENPNVYPNVAIYFHEEKGQYVAQTSAGNPSGIGNMDGDGQKSNQQLTVIVY